MPSLELTQLCKIYGLHATTGTVIYENAIRGKYQAGCFHGSGLEKRRPLHEHSEKNLIRKGRK